MVAPYAMASSMFSDLFRLFPSKYSERTCWTRGMREEPPTKTISSISCFVSEADSSTYPTGLIALNQISRHKFSNFALFKVMLKSSPSANSSHSIVACSA